MEAHLDILQLAVRYYRRHAFAYAIAIVLASILFLLSVGGWIFWPLLIWTIVFLAHFLIVKSLQVDSDWVAERTAKTAGKAFDLSHIESIRERYEKSSSRYDKKSPADGSEAGGATPEPDETSEPRP